MTTYPQPQGIRQPEDTTRDTRGTDEDESDRHWPNAPIEDLDEEEREMLLKQAGPTGEMARHAWQQYQEQEDRERGAGQAGDEPQGIAREQQRLQEMGQTPGTSTNPQSPVTAGGSVVAPGAGSTTSTSGSGTGPANTVSTTSTTGPEVIDTAEEEKAETGSQEERDRAEAKAKELGLEVRDYGSAGDWRVYDPKTGRQVAKSTVLG